MKEFAGNRIDVSETELNHALQRNELSINFNICKRYSKIFFHLRKFSPDSTLRPRPFQTWTPMPLITALKITMFHILT